MHAMPVLTKQLKYFTESPGGQSDDIRQQQRDAEVGVFFFDFTQLWVCYLFKAGLPEFPLSQSTMLCSIGGMTKQCYLPQCSEIFTSVTAAATLGKDASLLLEEGYDLGRCRAWIL